MWLRRVIPATALLMSPVAVCLLACEVLLRVAFDPSRVLDGDARWEFEWRRSRTTEPPGSERPDYSFDTYDAVLGWRPSANYRSAEVHTNAQGIRADRDFPLERRGELSRIVLLGDSFIWGEDVSNDETFATVLEDLLGDSEVINLGVHGYGTDQQLLRLRLEGFPFEPDVVLLGFYDQDLYRNVLRFRDYAKPRFKVQGDDLSLENTPVPRPEEVLAREQRLPRSFLWVVARRVFRKALLPWGRGLEDSEAWEVTRVIFNAAKRETEASGGEFVLVYIPYADFREPSPVEPLVTAWAAQSGAWYVNLRQRFLEMPPEDQDHLYDGHWTSYGNEVVARLVAAFLQQTRGGGKSRKGGHSNSREAVRGGVPEPLE